jgi:hypothetical protein
VASALREGEKPASTSWRDAGLAFHAMKKLLLLLILVALGVVAAKKLRVE